jgi:hypothetical protein
MSDTKSQAKMNLNSATGVTADEEQFQPLKEYLSRIPGVGAVIGSGVSDDGYWWVKFTLDLDHRLSWRVVQELGHVLNYVSLDEKLPTVFMPVSPPPYLNGGPRDFLSWVIECRSKDFDPVACAEWLEGRLPRPVEDESQWDADIEA